MERTPVLFVGHGSPMHALSDDEYTRALRRLGRELGRPEAVVCLSAHWITEGTWATHMAKPKTIHDFYGFPRELFDVRYPAPGSPEVAELICETVAEPRVQLDDGLWGLDHGCWAVLRHLYPDADVPVVQLSVYLQQPGRYHLEVGRRLAPLREREILILGSGNVVHNLPQMKWTDDAQPYGWTVEFDAFVKLKTEAGEADVLAGDPRGMPGGALSVPTPDHWYLKGGVRVIGSRYGRYMGVMTDFIRSQQITMKSAYPHKPSASAERKSSPLVLVVEDDPTEGKLLLETFAAQGFRHALAMRRWTSCAPTPAEAKPLRR